LCGAAAAAILTFAHGAAAQDGPDCFPEYTTINVCEKALEYQRKLASSLPMKWNGDGIPSTSTVIGRRIVVTAIWHWRKADVNAWFRGGNMSLADLQASLSQMIRKSVCSNAELLAFLRLGGQMQYVYKTRDEFVVTATTIASCPSQRHRHRLATAGGLVLGSVDSSDPTASANTRKPAPARTLTPS
jgi:hypothetical protein